MKRYIAHQAQLRAQEDRLATLPSGGMVISADPRKGTVTWGGVHGRQSAPVAHPYIGSMSWLRICPDRGTKLFVGTRAENMESYISAYVAEDISGSSVSTLIEATESGKFYFRVLKEGEYQFTSSGLADVNWYQNGNLALRGGAVAMTLSNTKLEAHTDAPVHRRTVLDSQFLSIGNEERFGSVTRPSPIDATQQTAVKVNGKFVKEYLRSYTLPDLRTAAVDFREGMVIEDNGTPALLNGAKLRARLKYGTTTGDSIQFVADETGNVVVTIPQSSMGLVVKTVQSDMKLDVGKNLHAIVTEGAYVTAKTVKVSTNNADSVYLSGSQHLLTEAFGTALQGANALPVASTPADAVGAVNAVVAFLKTLPASFQSALTVRVTAG